MGSLIEVEMQLIISQELEFIPNQDLTVSIELLNKEAKIMNSLYIKLK